MHFNVVCLWGLRSVSKPVLRYFMSSSGSESILGEKCRYIVFKTTLELMSFSCTLTGLAAYGEME